MQKDQNMFKHKYTCINSFKISMKPENNSIENSVDPDKLASEEAS